MGECKGQSLFMNVNRVSLKELDSLIYYYIIDTEQ